MPAYSRDSGVWTQTVMRQRDSAAWSGEDALGFVRENGAWVQFQAPVGAESLLQPINLVAVPTDLEATFTWDNPTPLALVTPTHVQLRIPSTTAVWTEIPYPDAEIQFSFLSPSTDYQFQARYIERSSDDGTIVLTGNITEVFFTTTALVGPGTPAEDPGGTGPDSTVPWGTPSGGSSCTWEYIVQTATTPASGAITWDDTAVTGSFAGTLSSLEIDFVDSGLACGALARFKYRENCSGVLSDYLFGEPFVMQCDWDVTCGGIAASTSLANSLYSDPNCLLAFPELCGTRIQDKVNTSIELGKLPGFGSIQTFNGPHTVYGKTSNGFLGKPTLGGQFGNLALLVDGDDLTVTANMHLEAVPGGPSGGSGVAPASMPVVRFGRNVAISAVFSTTTTYIARCSWIDATGTFQSVTGATDLSLDEFHRVAVVLDADGTKTLYVDGVADGTNTDTTALAFSDAGIGQDIEVYTNKFMRFNDVAAWDRVLTASEIALLNAPPYPYYISESTETITAAVTTFDHALPSSIQSGDMIMVLWKPNNSGSVKTFGATPAGWTAGSQEYSSKLYYKIADGTETTMTLTWTGNSDVNATVHSLVYRNVDPADPFWREPVVNMSVNTSNTICENGGVGPATSEDIAGSPDNLDNWTSYMEGSSYVGLHWSSGALTLSPSTAYQPNVLERPTTVNAHDHRHWSHEGITENSGLYNDQRTRHTLASGWIGSVTAVLRAPRTAEWDATTHVAFKRTILGYSAFDSALAVAAENDHFDGLLTLMTFADAGGVTPAVDTTFATNTWMTQLSHSVYYGTWAAAGRSVRVQAAATQLVTTMIIANANTSDPASMVIQRRYNTQSAGRANYFWTRADQLVIGTIRSNNFDASDYTAGASTAITVEHQDWQTNTSAGNQTGHVLYGRALATGYGFLPSLTAATNWDQNSVIYVGINHSSESSPGTLLTPTIVGTPTAQSKSVGGSGVMTITKPSGCQVGEMILMVVHLQVGGEITSTAPGPPEGFEPLDQDSSGSGSVGEVELWYKVVDGTEPASWAPVVNGEGSIVLQRVTGILPMVGFRLSEQSGTVANPQPFGTPNVYKPGLTLRVGAYQDGTARVVAVSVGTDIVADIDIPPLSTSTTHLNMKGEVIAGTTPGAANWTLTPFPGAPSTARGGVYHLSAGPA